MADVHLHHEDTEMDRPATDMAMTVDEEDMANLEVDMAIEEGSAVEVVMEEEAGSTEVDTVEDEADSMVHLEGIREVPVGGTDPDHPYPFDDRMCEAHHEDEVRAMALGDRDPTLDPSQGEGRTLEVCRDLEAEVEVLDRRHEGRDHTREVSVEAFLEAGAGVEQGAKVPHREGRARQGEEEGAIRDR